MRVCVYVYVSKEAQLILRLACLSAFVCIYVCMCIYAFALADVFDFFVLILLCYPYKSPDIHVSADPSLSLKLWCTQHSMQPTWACRAITRKPERQSVLNMRCTLYRRRCIGGGSVGRTGRCRHCRRCSEPATCGACCIVPVLYAKGWMGSQRSNFHTRTL